VVTDVASDLQDQGLGAQLVIDRDTAARLGIAMADVDNTLYDAFGQRQVSTIFTQLNQYHVVMEVGPNFQTDPSHAEQPLRQIGQRHAGSAQHVGPLGAVARATGHRPPGPVPSTVVSFNLAPGKALGDAVKRSTPSSSASRCRWPSTPASRARPPPSRPRSPTSRC
jgi:multidrug efflux pump